MMSNYSAVPRSNTSLSQNRKPGFNLVRASDDNPLNDSISKYYDEPDSFDQSQTKSSYNRDHSFSHFEKDKEQEARLHLTQTLQSNKPSRQRYDSY